MPFRPGVSGNPGGRPKGTKAKITKIREQLEASAEAIICKVIEQAEGGCLSSQRLCIERILPVYKPSAEPVTLDGYEFLNSPEAKARAVADAVCMGKIGPEAGRDFVMALQSQLAISKAGEEREALNQLLERNGLPRLDPKPGDEAA